MSGKINMLKLTKLRELMKNVAFKTSCNKEKTGIEAYIIPHCDAHQSEYTQKRDQRIKFISGFSGSYGTIIVTADKALLWTDGRYFSQAKEQLDPPDAWTLMKELMEGTPTVDAWLTDNLPSNSSVAVDPMLMNDSEWKQLETKLTIAGHELIPLDENLVDKIWGNERPAEELKPVIAQTIQYSGKTAKEKVDYCFQEMKKQKSSILVLSALDEIAYLLNWRGSDIPFNPVFMAYVVLVSDKVHIFMEKSRLTAEAENQLVQENINAVFHSYNEIRSFLQNLAKSCKNANVWIPSSSSYALHAACKPLFVQSNITPTMLMKLVKNPVEIEGMKKAHIKDAVAIVKYFAWLEKKIKNGEVVTEITGPEQLEKFRHEQENYRGPSFETISAVGANGAIIHYKSSKATDVPINNREFYLCDCGSQFPDGTTDVTRTLHFGEPSMFERECYTRVFKGQTSLARAKFPARIIGNYLDTFARKALWDVGLDYLHGTGHGVGAYLNVHEYPTMISWKPYPNDPGVQPGMFLSNEPGYYEDGKFGIRLENVELIVKTDTKYDRLNRNFLTFETVTLVPIQTKHLVKDLLIDEEIQFINNYHKKVFTILSEYLQKPEDSEALDWLTKETKPI